MRLIDVDVFVKNVVKSGFGVDFINRVTTLLIDTPIIKSKQGKWVEHEWAEEVEGLLISNYECSECHSWERSASNYCPNCGAKMKGESDE